jgi:membrane associated rhomboid family serine protease
VVTAKLSPTTGGVAVWAHIGGFVAGMLLIKIFENPRLVAKRNAIREQRHWMATA